MSKTRSRRNSPTKSSNCPAKTPAAADLKVFYIPAEQLEDKNNVLHLERFYHPGKGRTALFMTLNDDDDRRLLEVLEYAEPRRSWLIGNRVCSNGRIYMVTPIDATFLALHHIRRHCAAKALALDNISGDEEALAEGEDQDKEAIAASTRRLLTTFVAPEALRCVADVKTAAGTNFYKYNATKTLAWLALKTRAVAASLRAAGVHCGSSALSQNYARSERAPDEELAQPLDYLRMACDIVGGYLDLELHVELVGYLEIPNELKGKTAEAAKAVKRKSLKSLSAGENKKAKLNVDREESNEAALGAAGKLKNSSLLDESLEEKSMLSSPTSASKPTPLKERSLSAKEKALAKGAKGTKSISSFFKK